MNQIVFLTSVIFSTLVSSISFADAIVPKTRCELSNGCFALALEALKDQDLTLVVHLSGLAGEGGRDATLCRLAKKKP